MTSTPDREELLSRLKSQCEETIAANAKLAASTLKNRELLEDTRALLAKMRAERDRLRSVMDSIVEEIWYCDAQRIVSPMNPAAQRLLRLYTNEGDSLPLPVLLSRIEPRGEDGVPLTPDETPLVRSLGGETVNEFRELVSISPARGVLVREVNSSPVMDETGNVVGAVAVVRRIA